MFLFKLITSEEFLHLETEAHVCAFLSLWLSEFSKGKVLNLKGVSQNEWEVQEELQNSETPPKTPKFPRGPPESQQYPQNFSNIARIPEHQYHPMNPQNFTNTPEHLKRLRTSGISQAPAKSSKSSTGWGEMVKTMMSSCRNQETLPA